MKVTGLKSFSVADSDGNPYFFVKVERDDGIYGLVEVGIHRWGAPIAKAIEHLSEVVVGVDPFSTERLWQRMFRGSFFPADKVYSCALSTIDIALWDIKGKARPPRLQAPGGTRPGQDCLLPSHPRKVHRGIS
jgi:mannonate dehydratase